MNGLSDVRLSLHSRELDVMAVGKVPSIPPGLSRWKLYCHRWVTRQQLRELTPDELRDIGLTTTQARHEAMKPFWRE